MVSLLVRAALIAAAVLSFMQALPPSEGRRSYGRDLLSEHEVPLRDVQRYAAQVGAAGQPATAREPWNVGSMWAGPLQGLGIGRNPYTLVLTVSGTARQEGDVRTHWQGGWEVHEGANAVREMLLPMTGLSSGRVSAGAPVTLNFASGSMSFRGERRGSPVVNLVAANNIDIDAVKLQVWSGHAPSAWPLDRVRIGPLVLGLICLAACFVLHRAAAGAPQPRWRASSLSRPPVAEAPSTTGELSSAASRAAPAFESSTLPGALVSQPMVLGATAPALPPEPAPAAPAAAEAPRSSPTESVVASLRDVLARGLSVPSEPDLQRRGRRHRAA